MECLRNNVFNAKIQRSVHETRNILEMFSATTHTLVRLSVTHSEELLTSVPTPTTSVTLFLHISTTFAASTRAGAMLNLLSRAHLNHSLESTAAQAIHCEGGGLDPGPDLQGDVSREIASIRTERFKFTRATNERELQRAAISEHSL